MAIIVHAKKLLKKKTSNNSSSVPKGCCAVYVGDEVQKKRFVIPVSYLNHHEFRALLSKAVEEYGYSHPMGGLTIPCSEHIFLTLTSRLGSNKNHQRMSTKQNPNEDYQFCSQKIQLQFSLRQMSKHLVSTT
ncbi:auxin-responsive protein SAUR21-like [Cannabis sativa]|uniref:auxin-responsive protein SAUR21-like n=1 Tax=Cannabis sativa TaxID=3483 RepID=UPI0029CA86B3|nr:auxin-responsive protein SAUR21-like [Cannabis sativa]